MMEIWAEGIRSGTEFIDLNEMYDQYRTMLSTVLDDGIRQGVFRPHNSVVVASIIIGALDGLFLQIILGDHAYLGETAADEMISLVMNGIGNENSES